MTSQAILGDNYILVKNLESGGSKSSKASKANRDTFQKVMDKSNEGQKIKDKRLFSYVILLPLILFYLLPRVFWQQSARNL